MPGLVFPEQLRWLNVERPLTAEDLKGTGAILDFWTYGCINCIHVAEELRESEARFGNRLAVIGTHSPKFENEKNLETLRNTLVRLDRRHPIVNDPDSLLMRFYGVCAWPTLALFAPDGRWVGQVSGEGNVDRLAHAIEAVIDLYKSEMVDRPLPIKLEKDRFVADAAASAIRRIRMDRQRVEDLVGKGLFEFGDRDGELGGVLLQHAAGVASLDRDRLLIADSYNHKIKLLDLAQEWVNTLLATGDPGASLGSVAETRLNEPGGLAVLEGQILMADTNNHRILVLDTGAGTVREWTLHD
ncbi:MAG: hypothetical protein LJE70_02755 [Chromatiaceae bacterium]|nr:hypothetical protein [Chromatiaceae bacterium]